MNKRSGINSKENILIAARCAFAEHGYARASMRMIAKEAGMSVGGMYLYFADKEELYLTIMQESFDYLNKLTNERLRDITDPVEALRAFITLSLDYAKSQRERILLQVRELGITFGLPVRQNFFRERRKIIENIICQGIELGVFKECNAQDASKVIFSSLRGFFFSMAIDEDGMFSPEECVNLILNGLLDNPE